MSDSNMSYDAALAYDLLHYSGGVHWTARSPVDQGIVGGWAKTSRELGRAAIIHKDWNFYISLNQPDPSFKGAKPAKNDITVFGCVGIDIDLAEPIINNSVMMDDAVSYLATRIHALFGNADRYCGTIIASGRGLWVWIKVQPILLVSDEARAVYDRYLKGFVRGFAAQCPKIAAYGFLDTTCGDLSRIARCPGSTNHANGKMAKLLRTSTDSISQEAFAAFALPYLPDEAPAPEPLVATQDTKNIITRLNVTSRQFCLNGVPKSVESRHRRLWSTAKNMQEIGVTREAAAPLLREGANRCSPKLAPRTVDRVMTQIWGQG